MIVAWCWVLGSIVAQGAALVAPGVDRVSADVLVARMVDRTATFEVRAAAEDELLRCDARSVLPVLLEPIGRGMPSHGAIYNSGGRELDHQAPSEWQVFYSVRRVWDEHVYRLVIAQDDGALLVDLLEKSSTDLATIHVLSAATQLRALPMEAAAEKVLCDGRRSFEVRTVAAGMLLSLAKQNHIEIFLDAYRRSGSLAERTRWFEVLSDPRQKAYFGVDPRVVAIGFDLVVAARDATPGYIHGAYFAAIHAGSYVAQDFMPDKADPRYAVESKLPDVFFEDTVENALRWWETHRGEFVK